MNNGFDFNAETDRPVAVAFHDETVWVTLADGRTIGNPLDWHPWLPRPRMNSGPTSN